MGWTVIRIWEHEVRFDVTACANRIYHAIHIITEQAMHAGLSQPVTAVTIHKAN